MSSNTGVWDTHVHILDPSEYPYSSVRTYTPPAALPGDLFDAMPQATNFLFVQATVERDSESLLHYLTRLRRSAPTRTIRGALMIDTTHLDSEISALRSSAASLHETGIRCLRIHGQFQSPSRVLTERVATILRSPLADIARQHQWSISMRLPVEAWADLKDVLETHCRDLKVIAEHCGGFTWPPQSHNEIDAMQVFLQMLRQKLLYVKLGALHRRVRATHHTSELIPTIQMIADAGPGQLIWGSDWPHVNTEAKGHGEAPFLKVDEAMELYTIRSSMSEECFNDMLRTTPASLFQRG